MLLHYSWVLWCWLGFPLAFASGMGWLNEPKEHMLPLVLGGIVLFFVVSVFIVAWRRSLC